MKAISVFQYNESPIEFELVDGRVMANATAMCKPFNKDLSSIFRTQSWAEFEQAVCEDLNVCSADLRITKKGNSFDFEQGTWIHQELVLELARRLNPKFAIWCNRKIAELLRTGKTEVAPALPQTYKEALQALLVQVEEKEQLLLANQTLQAQREADQPKVEFYEAVTDSKDVADLGRVAKVLNVPNIGRTKLFSILRDAGILRHNNEPYQEYVDKGWFRIIETSWAKPDGSTHVYFKTVAFQKGIDGIRRILSERTKKQPSTQLSIA